MVEEMEDGGLSLGVSFRVQGLGLGVSFHVKQCGIECCSQKAGPGLWGQIHTLNMKPQTIAFHVKQIFSLKP